MNGIIRKALTYNNEQEVSDMYLLRKTNSILTSSS